MPILKGAVTFARFMAKPAGDPPKDQKQWIGRGLRGRAFEPLDRRSDQDRAAGFVELEAKDSVEFAPGSVFHAERALFSFRVDTLKVPAPQLKAELEKWIQVFEKDKGRPPRRAEKAEGKAAVRAALRSRAEPREKLTDVSWNLKTGRLEVWASSRKAVDEVQQELEKAFDLELTAQVPAAVADALELAESALGPTPELSWPDFKEGARDGQA